MRDDRLSFLFSLYAYLREERRPCFLVFARKRERMKNQNLDRYYLICMVVSEELFSLIILKVPTRKIDKVDCCGKGPLRAGWLFAIGSS